MSKYHADRTTVGEWSGQEQLAADQFNIIVDEILSQTDDDDAISDAVHWAWDEVGSDEDLLTMTEAKLKTIAQKYA